MLFRRWVIGLLVAGCGATIAADQAAPARLVLIAGRPRPTKKLANESAMRRRVVRGTGGL